MNCRESQQLSEWFESLLESLRENALTTNPLYNHFKPPCQIDVFWIAEPIEGQLAVITNDEERSDKQIVIHCPFSTQDFIEEVEEIVSSENWQRPVSNAKTTSFNGQLSRADKLTEAIMEFKNELENSLFSSQIRQHLSIGKKRLWENGHYFINIGNIENYEVRDVINPYLVSGDVQEDLYPDKDLTIPPEIDALGGFIREPVWIGNPPDISFEKKILGSLEHAIEPIFEYNLFERKLYIRSDGLILIQHHNRKQVRDFLNIFLGMGLLQGFRTWKSLQDRDMVSGGITDGRITSWGVPAGREELTEKIYTVDIRERETIPINKLESLIDLVEFIYPIDYLSDSIILHLQAHTHLIEEEFRASFALNWTAIEQIIEKWLLREINSDYNIDWGGKELEYASITDSISHEVYELLDNCREKRNNIIHEMEEVSVLEAEKLDIIAASLIVRAVNYHSNDGDVPTIEFDPQPIMHDNQDSETMKMVREVLN